MDLSCHYIGQHVVKNYFLNARRLQRERIVLALVGPSVTSEMSDRLRRCKEGQGVLRHTNAELWSRNPAEWKAQMNKHDQGLALLRDLNIIPSSEPVSNRASTKEEPYQPAIEKSVSVTSNHSHVPTVQVAGATDVNTQSAEGKKKRKRKRGGKAKQQGSADAESIDEASGDEDVGSDLRPPKKAPTSDATVAMTEIPVVSEPKLEASTARDRIIITSSPPAVVPRDRKPKEGEYRGGSSAERRASSDWPRPQRDPPSSFAPLSKRADMSLVRSLQSGKMMSKSMLNDAINRLESEKKKS